MSSLLICSGSKVLLPGCEHPKPASIIIDKVSGKIIEVVDHQANPGDFALDDGAVEWVDSGDNVVLPGLVECVTLC